MRPAPSPVPPSSTLRLLQWLVPLAVALWAGWDLLAPWDVDGHSVYLNHIRLVALDATLRDGGSTLRWLPQLYFGHGSPLFNYLAPLPTLLALAGTWLGLDAGTAIKVVVLLSLLGMAASASWLAGALGGPWAGLAAGVLVVLAPYPLVDVYVRAQLGETLALALAPVVLLAVHRLDDGARDRWPVLGGGALALVVLSHNIAALMLCAVTVGAIAARAWQGPWRSVALRGSALLALGLGLSAWFWLPALAETDLVQARASLTGGALAYDLHFVTVRQLLGDAWGYGTSGPGDRDGMPLQAGRLHLLLWLVACGLALWRRREIAGVTWLLLAVAPLALWLTTAASSGLWRALPLMPYVQFPWRFLLLFALAAAVVGGQAIGWLAPRLHPTWRGPALGAALGLLLLATQHQVHARYVKFNTRTQQSAVFEKDQGPLVDREPGLRSLTEVFTAQRVRERGGAASIGDEYLPRDVVDKPRAPASQAVEVVSGTLRVLAQRTSAHTWEASLQVATPSRVHIHQFAFPGWVARVDGRRVPVEAEPGSGLLLVELAPGERALELRFELTPLRLTADLVSLAAVLAAASALGASSWRRRRASLSRAPAP